MIEKILVIDRNTQFVDEKPILGKLQILRLESTTLADIYTLNGETFVPSRNPVYTNAEGRILNDVFADAGIYLVKLFKYIGDITATDDSDDAHWEFVREFYVGLENVQALEAHSVETIEALKNVDPSQKICRVVGYWNETDCEPRLYFYDENCTQDDDAGYIIKSDVTEEGAWILLTNQSEIPSTYYGVYPEHEENFNYLMSYPATVGSFAQTTAKTIYLVPGVYNTSSVPLVTDKNLKVDAETLLGRSYVQANSVQVIGKGKIGNIRVNGGSVYSSWFETAEGFWSSGADKFIIDSVDFHDDGPSSVVALDNKVIEGNVAIPANNLRFVNCHFEGERFLRTTDSIEFRSMEFKDTWFYGINLDMTKLALGAGKMNIFKAHNFRSMSNFTACMKANIAPTATSASIDFEGNEATSLDLGDFTDIFNLRATSITINKARTRLKNCEIQNLYVGDTCVNLVLEDSTINIRTIGNSVQLIDAQRSSVGGNDVTKDIAVTAKNSDWNLPFKSQQLNLERQKSFYNCTIGQIALWSNNLHINQCRLNNTQIKVYFHTDGSRYKWLFNFSNNLFSSNSPIDFTYLNDSVKYQYGIDCEIGIFKNVFAVESLKMAYMTPDLQHRMLEGSNVNFIYKENLGNCPLEKVEGTLYEGNWVNVGTYQNKVSPQSYRVFNLAYRNEINPGEQMNNCNYLIAKNNGSGIYTMEYHAESSSTFLNEIKLVHRGAIDVLVNDQFEVYMTTTNWHEQNLVVCF